MPGVVPDDVKLNINEIESLVYGAMNDYFAQYNFDISTPEQRRKLTHNELTACLKYIYRHVFASDITLCNNQNSKFDYNDTNVLMLLANIYIDIALLFNKSLGLLQFCLFIGIDPQTMYDWLKPEAPNPARGDILKNIREYHKMEQINLLNGSPVGALAVANNDTETGLEWTAKQAQQLGANTVFLLPSERVDKLRLEQQDN